MKSSHRRQQLGLLKVGPIALRWLAAGETAAILAVGITEESHRARGGPPIPVRTSTYIRY